MISVLTEPTKFSGSLNDLDDISKTFSKALTMRKDFLVEPYQVSEAFMHGAMVPLIPMLSDAME